MSVEKVKIKIKRISEDRLFNIPQQGMSVEAGYDLCASFEEENPFGIAIAPHETVKIGTNMAMEFSDDYWLGIYPRSGIATKRGLRPENTPGVVDPNYRGEIIVALHNDSDKEQVIKDGERIAQAILHKRYEQEYEVVDELTDTDRGEGGFGSTGRM